MKNGWIHTLLTAFLFATFEPVSKLIAGGVDPFAITFWRFLIGAAALLPFALPSLKQEKQHITAVYLGKMLCLALLFVCGSMIFLQLAVAQADNPSLIAIIFSSNSVFTILLAIPVLKERLTKYKVYAVLLCILGVTVCSDFSAGADPLSVALALLSAVTFSLYSILNQKAITPLGGIAQCFLVFFAGSLLLLPCLFAGKAAILPEFTPINISVLCYVGLFVTGAGYWNYFKAIEKGGAVMGALAFFIKPILTPFIAWAVNGILPGPRIFLALLLIILGSRLASAKDPEVTF